MSTLPTSSTGTIRSASLADAGALARLCAALGLDVLALGAADIAAYLDRGHLIVLDSGDGTMHARIELFAVHPALAGNGTEDRMAAALLALCEASGCVDLVVGSAGRPARRTQHPAGGR